MPEVSAGRVALALGVVIVGAAAVGLWFGVGRGVPPPVPPVAVAPASTATAPATATVHVTGAVVEPGLVVVPEGSRVADVVAAAGGSTASADLGVINLAQLVTDGDRVHIPNVGERADPGTTEASGVDLNRASAAELEALDGVGPVLARRIVEWRDAYGPFATVEDLLDVPGIGEAKLAGMRDGITAP